MYLDHNWVVLGTMDFPEDPELLGKLAYSHRAVIASSIRLRVDAASEAQRILKAAKCRPDGPCKIIGVHARRGDYKTYKDGRWFLEVEHYEAAVREFTRFSGWDSYTLILCSDERDFSLPAFGDVVIRSHCSFKEDLWLLSQCDAIIGPPSTFSGLASYIGEVPILHVNSRASAPSPSDVAPYWTPQYY